MKKLEETISVEEDLEVHEKRNAEFAIMERALNSLGEPCKNAAAKLTILKKKA